MRRHHPSWTRSYGPLWLSLALLSPISHAEPLTEVRLVLTLEPPLPEEAKLYLAGSHPTLGPWRADGLALTPLPGGTWLATLKLPPGTPLEFKFTLGSWAAVERSPEGHDVPNRTLTVPAADTTIRLTAARFTPAGPAARPSTVTGTLRLHEAVRAEALGNARTLRVWLPPGYDDHPDRRYPVIYFHDGQNLFDTATSAFGTEWQLDEALTRLLADGLARPAILVGIDNTPDRIPEYTADANGPLGGGRGDLYARFIVETVKPLIDRTYRTLPDRPHTFTAGSSLGGLISLQLLRTYPDTFGGAAIVSPALWWADQAELKRWSAEAPPQFPADTRLWLDMGTAEGPPGQWDRHLNATRALHAALRQHPRITLAYEEAEGAEHNEAAWAQRAPRILRFLLTP